MLRTQTFSCSSVSKTLQIHPPNDHCSELNAFLFLSLPLVISHFSSLVILTMDYVVHNLSLYLHVSRMTFLFVRGRKSPKSLKTWVSLILSNKWQLISIIEFFFPLLKFLIVPVHKGWLHFQKLRCFSVSFSPFI